MGWLLRAVAAAVLPMSAIWAKETGLTADKDLLASGVGLSDVGLAVHRRTDYGGQHPFERVKNDRRKMRRATQSSTSFRNDTSLRNGRSLTTDADNEYENMRIYFYVQQLEDQFRNQPELLSFLKNELLDVGKFWSAALRVYPAKKIKIDEANCLKHSGSQSDADLIVIVLADMEGFCFFDENRGVGTLASALNCQTDQFGRPTVGIMFLCSRPMDMGTKAGREETRSTILHEFTHILGFMSPNLPFFHDRLSGEPRTKKLIRRSLKCVDGVTRSVVLPSENTLQLKYSKRGVPHYEIVTPTVRTVVQNQFNCNELQGAQLENQPTAEFDCFGSHFDQRLFSSEYMSAIATGYKQHISPLTLALLEDSGWYIPDYSMSELSPFGHGVGCEFVFEDCVVNGLVLSYGEGTFCNDLKPLGCSPGHRKVAACDLKSYNDDLPFQFRYFPKANMGGSVEQFDYCPTYRRTKLLTSAGSVQIDCEDESLSSAYFAEPFESYGTESRCFETTDFTRPVCLQYGCSEEKHRVEVYVKGEMYPCEYDGQEIRILRNFASTFRVICPRLAEICPDMICPANCAGRGFCDYSRQNPECVCFDPKDPSPSCLNSPQVPPSSIPAPPRRATLPPASAPSRDPSSASTSDRGPSDGPIYHVTFQSAAPRCQLHSWSVLFLAIVAGVWSIVR